MNKIGGGQPNITPQLIILNIRHLTALLKQGKEIVRAVEVLITRHTIDYPETVATASIAELRRDSMLWAAFNRG